MDPVEQKEMPLVNILLPATHGHRDRLLLLVVELTQQTLTRSEERLTPLPHCRVLPLLLLRLTDQYFSSIAESGSAFDCVNQMGLQS